MSVVDLPAALGIDLSHCTYAAEQASKDSSLHITLSQGELFSPLYIDNLASEVEEILSTEGGGATTISELALRFGLAADLLTSFLKPKLSSRYIKAKLDGGVIYTDAFITRLKAQIRGALRGATAPLPLSTLTKTLTTSSGNSSSSGALITSLLPNTIEELSNANKNTSSESESQQQPLQGKLSAGTWIPHCFVQSQQEGIKAAYAQNGYLTYDTVAKQGGGGGGVGGGVLQQSPKQFLMQTFPDGIALSECFISPMMVQQVESAVEEMMMSSLQHHQDDNDEDRGGWCDVLSIVPADISSFDAASILEKAVKSDGVLSRKKGDCNILASTVVMMNSLVEEIKSVVVEQAGKDAVEVGQKKEKVKGEEKAAVGGGAVSSLQSSKKQQQPKVDDDGDGDDVDWSMSKKFKKSVKKGGKKAATGGSGGGGKKGAKESKGTAGAPTSSTTTPAITTVPGIQAFIIQKYPSFEGAGVDGELPTALAIQIRPAAAAEYERASQAIFTAGADKRKKLRDAASRELQESHKKLQLYEHGVELFSDDEGTVVVLSRHLLRTVGSDCCDAVLRCVAADFDDVEVSTAEQKAALITQLPADQKAATQNMMTALNGSGGGIEMVGVFIAELEKAAETAAGVWLKKLDKKAEKQLVFAHWKGLEEKMVDEEQDGAAALALLVPMVVGKMHGRAVSLPGRALSAAVEKLKEDLPADQHALLVKFHGAVVELLKGGEGGDTGVVEMLGEVKGTKWGDADGGGA
jgi:hypothetical protein